MKKKKTEHTPEEVSKQLANKTLEIFGEASALIKQEGGKVRAMDIVWAALDHLEEDLLNVFDNMSRSEQCKLVAKVTKQFE